MKKNICIVVGTRPELIRLSKIIECFDKHTNLNLIHTGQNYDYELNQVFFENLGIKKPDIFLDTKSNSPVETVAKIIHKIDNHLENLSPDALIILGDTNSCLSAYPAKRRKIPIFHLEAGNRSFDQRVPEEINRKIVDHISDVNLTYSKISRDYLLREGFPPERTIRVGSPMKEVIDSSKKDIDKSKILKELNLSKDEYILCSTHREENIDIEDNFISLFTSLNNVSEEFKKEIILSTHPRTKKKIEEKNFKLHKNIRLLKPFGYFDYLKLQMNSYVVLSDSGTIFEESSILKFRAVCIRESNERPESFEESQVIMSGLKSSDILNSIVLSRSQNPENFNIVEDYNVGNVSLKILNIVHSYIDFVQREVWKTK